MTRRVHFVGIGGAGLSAIARVLYERGEIVTGSDQAESPYGRALEEAGVSVEYGHKAEHVGDADLVIASSAVPDSNIELTTARSKSIPVLRRNEFLGDLTAGFQTVAVAGTHGKTTTSGLIAWLFDRAGMDPSFVVGGMLGNFGTNARAGGGKLFVIEADEYDRAFLGLQPSLAVITNIEHDHPDCYPTLAAVIEAFNAFADRVTECMVVCADSPEAADLVRPHLIRITYGLHPTADWRAEEIRPNSAGGMDFLIFKRSDLLGLVRTRLPGEHNVRNVLGAVAVADYMDVPFATIRQALTGYHGVGRRFEILGTQAGVTVIDDYAHHPTEIKATLAAARMQFPDGKIWAVFQPHTYSRLRALIAAYTGSFDDADQVIVTEVFAAREEQDEEMTGEKLAQEVRHHNVRFLPDFEEISGYLAQQVSPGDVVVTLSAGDANKVGKLLLKRLSEGKEGMGNAEG